MIDSCDLLVASCDSYLAAARITLGQIEALGIGGIFPVTVALGDERPRFRAARVVNRLQPGTWSSELGEALGQLQRDYVLLWLDDFVPIAVPSLEKLENVVRWAIASEAEYLRLNPTPRGQGPLLAPGVRRIPQGAIYRTSTILSVWRREVLMDLLKKEESAWQFELVGAERSDRFPRFFAHDEELVSCVNLIIKGRVDPRAERTLVARGVSLDDLKARRMTWSEVAAFRMKGVRASLLRLIPWRLRRWLRSLFDTDLKTRR